MMPSISPVPLLESAAPNEYEPWASSATNTRTLETLFWLLRYPLLRAGDLATLMRLSTSATAARLAQAHSDGYVRSVSVSLLGRWVARLHALTPVGLTCLADHDGPMVWERARRSQTDMAGLLKLMSDLPGVLVTQSFVLAVIAHAEESLCQQASQHVTWSWTRNMRLRPLRTGSDPQASSLSQRCDATVRLILRSIRQTKCAIVSPPSASDDVLAYMLIILWDSGLSRAQEMRRQLQSFLRIRDSYERQGRLAAFPTLLVLVPDARRAALWQAQALRLATERWLTHPLLGGALALNDSAYRGACGTMDEDIPSLPFSPTMVDTLNPWQTAWCSFAWSGTQLLSDLLQTGSDVGGSRLHAAASEQSARSFARYPASQRMRHGHDQVELARLTLQLDARSLRLLALLYLHPLLSTPHLAVALGVQTASVERMLRRLRRLDLVLTQTGSGVQHSTLSDLGVVLLAHCAHLPGGERPVQVSGQPPRVLQRYQREARSLARTPEHTEGVYNFYIALLQSCRAKRAQGHDAALLWWETGSVCVCAFRDLGGWHTIRPDGAGECRIEGQRFHFWLEWDRGTMGSRDLRAKFAAYLHFMRTGWLTAGADAPPPVLLLVTTTPDRLNETFAPLLRAMRVAGDALTVWGTTADLLMSSGALGASWRLWNAPATGSQGSWGALRPAFAPLDIRSAQT